MRVEIIYRNDPARPLTDPLPEKNGVVLRLVRGDLCDMFFGNWFSPPWPKIVVRHTFRIPLPFVAWRFGAWCGYLGAKIYGVDAEAYKNWLPAAAVYPGSLAFCFSIRPFADARGEA